VANVSTIKGDGATGQVTNATVANTIVGGSMTICAWVNYPATVASYGNMLGFRNGVDSDFYIQLNAPGAALPLEALIRVTGGVTTSVTGAMFLPSAGWHFIALVYTASDGLITYYLDGASSGTPNGAALGVFPAASNPQFFAQGSTSNGNFFTGSMYGAAAYAIALTQAQLAALAACTTSTAYDNLILGQSQLPKVYWKLNESVLTVGASITDYSTQGTLHAGTVAGTLVAGAVGPLTVTTPIPPGFIVPDLPAGPTALQTAQSRLNSTDLYALSQGATRTGVVSGCAVNWSAALSYSVAVGTICSTGTYFAVAAAPPSSAVADATNPRFDAIVVTAAGAVAIRTGTAAATPTLPILTAGDVILGTSYVPAGATTLAATNLTDKRVFLWSDLDDNAIYYPPQGVGTAAFIQVASTTYYQYLGRAKKAYASAIVRLNVSTAGVTLSYAEVGIFKGSITTVGTMPTLTKIATANATFTAIARVNTTVALSGVNPGDDLWAAVGVGTQTTAVQYTAAVADTLAVGYAASNTARPSTTTTTTPTALATAMPAMIVQFS